MLVGREAVEIILKGTVHVAADSVKNASAKCTGSRPFNPVSIQALSSPATGAICSVNR